MPKQKKIALLIESSRAYGRGLLRGVASYLHTHPDWSIYVQSRSPEDAPPPWLAGWDGDGIIARVESREMEAAIVRTGLPCVDVRGAFDLDMPLVETNEHSTCRLAFEHLSGRGFRHFAFCGYEGANYSERRLRYFRQLAEASGNSFASYQSPLPRRSGAELMLSSREQLALLTTDSLTGWLQGLPKPVGLLACNDVCVCHRAIRRIARARDERADRLGRHRRSRDGIAPHTNAIHNRRHVLPGCLSAAILS